MRRRLAFHRLFLAVLCAGLSAAGETQASTPGQMLMLAGAPARPEAAGAASKAGETRPVEPGPARPQPAAARDRQTAPASGRDEVGKTLADANRRLEELTRQRLLASQRMRALQQRIQGLQTKGRQEEQRVRSFQRRLDEEKANADRLAEEIASVNEVINRGNGERTKLRWIVAGIAALMLVAGAVAGLLLLRARRRNRALSQAADKLKAAEDLRANAKDWVLESPGRRVKLPGAGLANPERGVVVGRSTDVADVVIEGSEISRGHARFHLQDGRLYVTDLDSLNGVSVNNSKISTNSPHEVRQGDQISIATSDFHLRCL